MTEPRPTSSAASDRPAPSSQPTGPDRPGDDALLLALDAASPHVTVAVGRNGAVLAERSIELRRSSENLLRMVDEALGEAGVALRDLDGILTLRGPGSFTGLRVGLATVLGLHQALGVAATAVPTLPVVALAGRAALGSTPTEAPIAAVVDALRGEWFVQTFGTPEPIQVRGEPETLAPEAVADRRPALVAGFGAARLTAAPGWHGEATVWDPTEPTGDDGAPETETLAAAALRLHREAPSLCPWDPATLTSPLYLRAPAVSLPKRGRSRGAAAGAAGSSDGS